MKLNEPRAESCTSPDGRGSLTYLGLDYSHDMGGSDYRFLYTESGREVAIRARVQFIPRADRAARDEGIDLWSMTYAESEALRQKYYESHPREYQVIRFFPENEGVSFDISDAAQRFCALFLELRASYKLNNSDYPQSGEGYYWERVFFQPYDTDPKDHFEHSVGTPQ